MKIVKTNATITRDPGLYKKVWYRFTKALSAISKELQLCSIGTKNIFGMVT